MWRDLKHTLTRFVTISHIPSPKTSSTSPCNCNEARKCCLRRNGQQYYQWWLPWTWNQKWVLFWLKKKKKKKGGRKEVDGIHRKEPQKDGWETKELPKGKIELLFCWDLQCELGAKKKKNTCFRMNVNLSGTQWEGPGSQCWKVIQYRVSKCQKSALISTAPLTKLQFLSSFGGFHRYVCMPETFVNLLDLLYDLSQRRQWQPTPVLLPGKSHGQRSLAGYSSWSHKDLDTTEHLSLAHSIRHAH